MEINRLETRVGPIQNEAKETVSSSWGVIRDSSTNNERDHFETITNSSIVAINNDGG